MSINSGYGGNVLQGKKCFALRIASNLGRQEGWLAEHMLILGIQNPQGRGHVISTGAFPSACGKTNLAMLIPPEGLSARRLESAGAWATTSPGCASAEDGRLWAVNPENGFFGVAPGTTCQVQPQRPGHHPEGHHLHQRGPRIWTTTPCGGRDWTSIPPEHALDWRGNPWSPETAQGPAAHPNSRFTAPAEQLPLHLPGV